MLVPHLMTALSNLSPDERLKSLLQFQRDATPEHKAQVMAVRGSVGDTLPAPAATGRGGRPPRGWEPRVTYGKDGTPAEIFSPSVPSDLPEAEVLADTLALLNAMVPSGYRARIAEVRLDTAGWNRARDPETGSGVGEAFTAPCRRYRWVIEPVPASEELLGWLSEEEWDAARLRVQKRKYRAPKTVTDPAGVDLFIPHGDLQSGQGDGDTVEGLIARMNLYPAIAKAEIDRLKKCGTPVKRIVCPSLGDLVEGLQGWYPNQAWLVNLNEKQQRLVARRIIQSMLEEIATLGLPMLVPVVAGNHGENRRKGKMITDPGDNFDLEVMEVVAELFHANPVLRDQVEFVFAKEGRLTLTLDLGYGYGVGFTHGHLSGYGSGHPAGKMTNWLQKQALAEQPIGHAKYVVSGHFHSAMCVTMPGGRTWIQIPASCDESQHFTELAGLNGGPGFATFTLGPDGLSNWLVHKTPTLSTLAAEIVDAEAKVAAAKTAKRRAHAKK